MSHISKEAFQKRLLQWAAIHGRHSLPWQETPCPYRVLVSEVMLQQTQVSTVIPYFERWMQTFPTLQSLAQADEDTVMACWQGLGYYSRARNLQKAARYIMDVHQGLFPQTIEDLLDIPGVGRYTAGAIMSFAYNQFGPIVDGNVKRVFCRLFAIEGQPNQTAVLKKLWQLAQWLTPQQNNRAFAQGLLDLGATLCTPKKPSCSTCPFQSDCLAYAQNRISELPTPKPKKQLPQRTQTFLWIQEGHCILLEKRPSTGIWSALWCLPEARENLFDSRVAETRTLGQFRHTFSHYRLHAEVVHASTQSLQANQHWVSIHTLDTFGLPAPIRNFIRKQFVSHSYTT